MADYQSKCQESYGTNCIFCPYSDPAKSKEYFNCAQSETCCGDKCCPYTEHGHYEIPWYFVLLLVATALMLAYILYRWGRQKVYEYLPKYVSGQEKKKKQLCVKMDKDMKPITIQVKQVHRSQLHRLCTTTFSYSFPTIVIQSSNIEPRSGAGRTAEENGTKASLYPTTSSRQTTPDVFNPDQP